MLPLQLQLESHVPLYVQFAIRSARWCMAAICAPVTAFPRRASWPCSWAFTARPSQMPTPNWNLKVSSADMSAAAHSFQFGKRYEDYARASRVERQGNVRWESLFADERGEDMLSRLAQPHSRETAFHLLPRAPMGNYFLVAELSQCCQAVMRREGPKFSNLVPRTVTLL